MGIKRKLSNPLNYKTVLGFKVELTNERKKHIFLQHPDIVEHFSRVKQILLAPDEIRIDNQDAQVLLFYKYFSKIGTGKYLVAVTKTNKRNFILTVYLTHRLKTGEKYEFKK